jgi:ribose transport system substrate-binding protein
MASVRHDQEQGAWACNRRDLLRMAAGTAITLLLPSCRKGEPRPAVTEPLPEGWRDTLPYRKAPPWRLGRSSRGDISSWMVLFSAHIEYGVREKYRQQFRDYSAFAANWDPNKQIEDIRLLLRQDIDLLLIDPLDTHVVALGVQEAMAAGIPVVLASTRVRRAPFVSWVATHAEKRGQACADWLCQSVSTGRVAVLLSPFSGEDSEWWLSGVQARLSGQTGLEVNVSRCPWSSEGAKQAMDSLLNQSAPIDGLIVHNGVLGLGAVDAYVQRSLNIPPIAGGDDWNGWLRAAKQHQVQFFGLSGGANLGLHCVELATQVLGGKEVPAFVEFPYQTFDHKALERYYRPELSDHYWGFHDLPEAWIERMYKRS